MKEDLYRVSVKAVIRDRHGRVLAVRENGRPWGLPGGGLHHGETIGEGLRRELHEEVDMSAPFDLTLLGAEELFISEKSVWMVWLVYQVDPIASQPQFHYGVGVDADEVAFVDPSVFVDSDIRSEYLLAKWASATSTFGRNTQAA